MRASLAPGRVLVLACLLALSTRASGQETRRPLFDEPLHLTREVSDPISGTTSTLDEYCFGDRVISIRGSRTSIADYAAGTLTEIDRSKGSYSVTNFDAIARALPASTEGAPRKSTDERSAPLTDGGVRTIGGRGGRAFTSRLVDAGGSRTIEVVVDDQVKVSRDAVEVLVGAAFPLQGSEESGIALSASARDASSARTASGHRRDHSLPLEQTVTFESDGESLRMQNRVTRVGHELPPAELVAIPPGARLVESDIILRKRMLDEVDRLPGDLPGARP